MTRLTKARILSTVLMVSLLSSCYHPPYNNFKPYNRTGRKIASGTVSGAAVGVLAGGGMSGNLLGAAIGGTLGAANGAYRNTQSVIVKQLKKQDIQFVEYGDTMTLIVPTDKYYMALSPRLNEICYPGLVNIVRLLKLYPKSPIYVAGFMDNVGSRYYKNRMSQAKAETMLTFLWANGIRSARLKAEGYGDKNDVADNQLIHGSAQNRRIEIQWFKGLVAQADIQPQM